MTALIVSLIFFNSNLYQIDPLLVTAVIRTESAFNVNAVGPLGEIGLMQIRPEYFPNYTKEQLKDPKLNIKLGIEHLSKKRKYCKHQVDDTWVICYNLGISGGNKVKYPKLFPYYKKVMNAMKELKRDQKVFVLNLYVGTVDGEGIFIDVCKEKHNNGYYRILNNYGQIMFIEPERVFNEEDYLALLKERNKKSKYYV